MEGQVTKAPDGSFTAVRTGDFEDTEAIFIATADHPFGPWTADELPIIVKSSAGLELHEAIAPALIFDLSSGEKHLFYTGADYAQGWWLMLASEK